MASEKEVPCQNYCANDPNFAIICSFFDRFAVTCGITYPTFSELQEMIENPQDVPPELIDLHVKLLRKIRRSVAAEKWERALIKFCHSYLCSEEGWELERCGYKKCKVPVRLKILKTLLDAQFDLNSKFKNDINKLTPEELRLEPLGRDKVGQSYWCQFDSAANVRVYKEDQDEETWALVAKDREGLVGLITQLSSGEELLELELINEDSNSLEVENPIIDTGQVEQSTSEENTVDSVASKSENTVKEEEKCGKDNPINKASSHPISQEAIEGDNSIGLKLENGDVRSQNESKKCESVTLNESPDQVVHPLTNSDDCHKKEVKEKRFEENTRDVNTSDNKDNFLNNDNQSNDPISAPKTERELEKDNGHELLNENGVDQVLSIIRQPDKDDSIKEEGGEVKDVAEEIKQRSLSKTISHSMFKGKIGKSSSGSKLDKIFCHKLEQSYICIPNDSQTLENKSLTDDDSCSQTSVISSKQEKESVIDGQQGKRKADEVCDQSSKKMCFETEPNTNLEPEVGEEIEEPVMIIKGEGSGQECDTGNPGNESEDVVSDEIKNTTANKGDIIVTDAPIENRENIGEGFSHLNVLKNGIMNDNGSVNESVLNKDDKCIPSLTDISSKEDQESDVSEVKDTKTPCGDGTDHQETENEKSIEEQLSDLTGEGFSPKSSVETQHEFTESPKDKAVVYNNIGSEKGIRRKSLDETGNIEEENVPPEAKKTKVQKDCNDIFGTDDSLPFLGEDNKHVNEKVGLEENCSDSTVLDDASEQEKFGETKPAETVKSINSEINLSESTLNNETNNFRSDIDESNTTSKLNGDSDCLNLVSKLVEEKDKPPESNDSELKINEGGNEGNPKTNQVTLCEEDKSNKLESVDSTGSENIKPPNETIENESNAENIEPMKLCNKKRTSSIEEKVDDTVCTQNDSENQNLECPEKKKKIVCDDATPENKENSSEENNILEELDGTNIQQEKSDGLPTDDCIETLKTHKTPIKKAPKPRKKVFTPKSRKNRNKNKLNKTDQPDDNFALEEKNNLNKSNLKDIVPDNEIEITRDSENISEIKKDSKTTAKSIAGRKRRNSRKNNTDKESEEDLTSDKKTNTEAEEEIGGKRRKVKGKRAPNKSFRKSIEERRNCKSSSEEENQSDGNVEKEAKKSKEPKKVASAKQKTTKDTETSKNNGGKTKPSVKSPPKSKKEETSKNKKEDSNDDDKSEDESSEKKKKKSKSQGRNSRAYLGINLNIDLNDTSRSVRQSSRIAQIKIKEQADHKHGEEPRSNVDKTGKKSKKKKDDNEEALKGTPRKKKKSKKISDEDIPEEEPLSDRKKKRRRKRKHPVKAFNERDPWKSSSGSSSEAEEEEEDHFDDIVEEEEDIPLTIKSDHEFSPESDLEADEEWKPVRRARTAQKVKEPTEEAEESSKDLDDFACEKCGKKDHPEWILLCDTCNHGWHASCLRPSLMLVPEGDWHCPPCQHTVLVKKLQETLKIYDRDTKRRENEELRRKRLAYVGISLDNVLPGNAHLPKEKASGSESSETAESQSESESEYSDEPVYQLRQRRQGVQSYRFNEYDELINSAIRDEVEGSGTFLPAPVAAVEGTAIVNDGEEKLQTNESSVAINGEENKADPTPEVKKKEEKTKKKRRDDSDEESSEEEGDEDVEEDDFPRVVPKRTTLSRPGRKKHRKLNSLDDPSDDDDDDEDFKGSSSEEEEEEDEDDDSDESGVGRRRSRRGNLEPVRRSSRARKSRFDKEFINDDSEESDAPRRKKTKKLWSESDSESDDSTWGRRKKKKTYGSSRGKRFQKSKKFTIEDELSDLESSKTPKKKRQRKVKYGGLDDLSVEELPSRRTRGKKINYQEVLGTDSDEDIQKSKSSKKNMIEDDDEFDAEKEKQESVASSGEEESENEEKSTEEEEDYDEESENEVKSSKNLNQNIQNKENENHHKVDEEEEIKTSNEKIDMLSNKVSPPNIIPAKVSPPKVVNKDKPAARRGRPPKAMIAPPPERLISEDEQYKAVVSKVATVGHNMGEIGGAKAVNVINYPQKFSDTKDFMDPPQPVTPIKIPNSSFDPKLVKRSPPIKIRSGVPVNAGMKSPLLGSPSSDIPLYSVKSPNSDSLHSPPDSSQFQIQRQPIQQPMSARKSINAPLSNLKTEVADEEELDDEDLMEDIEEEEEEEDEEEESDEDVLEEGEIPKKVARRMARMEERIERLEKKKLAKQMEKLKSVQSGVVANQPLSPVSTVDQKPNPAPTTQPSQPLLRVVSPLKLMANPPGPLQSTFMNPGLNPRMPISSPPAARMPMTMRPPQPTNLAPGGEVSSRRGRGRGKKQEKEDIVGPTGGSVIRGMLQQPQSYPPSHYQQYPPSHPRIPFNPQQRMPRPPFHPGHPHPMDPSPSGGGPINVKQESGTHPVSNPVHIPNKPPVSQPYHPQHRFDHRPPGYPPPQANPRPQYGSYPPPPVTSAGYHYGSYPPPPQPSLAAPSAREDYVAPPQPQYNEQFSEPSVNPPPTSKPFSEEEGGGEFGGLVSYFSSQREEDIDT